MAINDNPIPSDDTSADDALSCIQRAYNRGYVPELTPPAQPRRSSFELLIDELFTPAEVANFKATGKFGEPQAAALDIDEDDDARSCIQRFYDRRRD
jgi:hypothetical protein